MKIPNGNIVVGGGGATNINVASGTGTTPADTSRYYFGCRVCFTYHQP